MAPRPPTKRPTSSLTNPYKTPHKTNKAPLKRQKRENKHATLLSRLSKPSSDSRIKKRRRPSKKLVTDLGDLEDALPETPITAHSTNVDREGHGELSVKIKHKSLKSRPGARKKKEKLVAMEMERFGKNMALMAAGSGTAAGGEGTREEMTTRGNEETEDGRASSSAERWAAIRGFISQTMERRPGEGVVSGKG